MISDPAEPRWQTCQRMPPTPRPQTWPQTREDRGNRLLYVLSHRTRDGASRLAHVLVQALCGRGWDARLADAASPLKGYASAWATIWWGRALANWPRPRRSLYVVHSPDGPVPGDLAAMAGRIDHVVGVSGDTYDLARAAGLPACHVPNGIPPVDVPARRDRTAPEQSFVVGYLGRLTEPKGVERLIRALALLPGHVRLRLIGDGDAARWLDLARKLDVAHRLGIEGQTDDAPRALGELDALALASDYEGCPLTVVEAMHHGCPVIATDVGDLGEILADGRGLLVRPDPHAIAGAVMRLVEDPRAAVEQARRARVWAQEHLTAERMAEGYERALEALRPDRREEITAFVVTSGEPSTAECIRRLEAQTVRVRVETIDRVTPMWRAFAAMHERVKTPFYVQVDADMMLQPDALERLHAGIVEAGEDCGQFCGWLWGDAEDRPIQGCKIYRTSIATRFPYADGISCEWPQFRAMEAAGYRLVLAETPEGRAGCVGEHFSLQTPEMAFKRWRRLLEKWRVAPLEMGMFAPYPYRHIMRAHERGDAIGAAMVAGAVAGLIGPTPAQTEADASQPDPDWPRLGWLLSPASQGPSELSCYMTSKCSHRCTWCRRQQSPEDDRPELFASTVRAALDAWPTIRQVCIAGFGEPLLSTDWPQVLTLCRDRKVAASIVTNGAHLLGLQHFAEGPPRPVLDILAEHKPVLSVSLNAATAARHRAVVGADTWDAIWSGIDAARARGLAVRLSAVVTRDGLDELPALVALAAEREIPILFHNLLPHGDPDDPGFLARVLRQGDERAAGALAAARALPGARWVHLWPTLIGEPEACPRRCQSPFVSVGVDGAGHTTGCRRVLPPSPAWGVPHATHWLGGEWAKLRAAMMGDAELPRRCVRCFAAWSEHG